jgi:O-antigen/teichoic acid export membrane protein
LTFGTPFIFGTIASTLFMMIDRFFLEHYTDRPEVGVYSMANSLIGAVGILVTMPFAQVWTVMRFKVMNEDGAEEYYAKVLTYIVYVSMFFALCIAAVAGDGLLLYALKSYYRVATILPMLAMAAVFDSASRVLNVGITLRKRTIYGPLLTLVALGFNIGLNFFLIPRYKSLGATISTLLSYLLFCALRYWVSNLFFKVPYEWGRVFTVVSVGALILGSFHLIDYLRSATPTRATLFLSMFGKAAIALVFPLVLFALRFYDRRELIRMGEIWERVLMMIKRRSLRTA